MSNGHRSGRVGVYCDEGASPWCVECSCKTLSLRSYTATKLTAEDVLSGKWMNSCVGIVFPGGRDSPYHDKLKGPGNKLIRRFVENGGWYLGLCAGGYFGSSRIDFCQGDAEMEIKTRRELAFFSGTAIGPRFPGFKYEDNSGERVVSISKPVSCLSSDKSEARKVYFNGGCYFSARESDQLNDSKVLWEYAGGSDVAPAVVGCNVGRGRAVLCGVHPEVGVEDLGNSQHLDSVISEMKQHDSDRMQVLDDVFMFLEGVS